MERRTYSELLAEVKAELDLQNETIITDNEYVNYANDTIQKAEGIIHNLHEDYFRTSAHLINSYYVGSLSTAFTSEIPAGVVDGVNTVFTLTYDPLSDAATLMFRDGVLDTDWTRSGRDITFTSAPSVGQGIYAQYQKAGTGPIQGFGLIAGTGKYALPTNIYANKIRELVFNDGDLIYEIKPYSPRHKQWKVEYMNAFYADDTRIFQYQLVNDSVYDPSLPYTTNIQIEMIPTPKITGDYITVYYLREAQKIPYVNSGDVQVDIPEFYDYIKFEMMCRCAFKSMNPKYEALVGWADEAKTRMIQTLSNRKEDGSKRIDADFSFYEDHV